MLLCSPVDHEHHPVGESQSECVTRCIAADDDDPLSTNNDGV